MAKKPVEPKSNIQPQEPQKMANFTDILDAPIDSAERPKPLPNGTIVFMVDGQPATGKSAQKQTPFVEFTLKALRPGDDVDADELEEFGGTAKLVGKTLKHSFYLTEDSTYRLKEFLAACGIDTAGKSGRQAISEANGCQVNGLVKRSPTQDGQGLRAEIKSFSAI